MRGKKPAQPPSCEDARPAPPYKIWDASVPAQPLANHRPGDVVKMALRPELLAPESTGEHDENQLTGTVENVAFLGAVVRIQVRVGESLLLVDEFNNPHLAVPAIGDMFTVYFRRENGLLLDA